MHRGASYNPAHHIQHADSAMLCGMFNAAKRHFLFNCLIPSPSGICTVVRDLWGRLWPAESDRPTMNSRCPDKIMIRCRVSHLSPAHHPIRSYTNVMDFVAEQYRLRGDVWRHLAITLDPADDSLRFYMDGVLALRRPWGSAVALADCDPAPGQGLVALGHIFPGNAFSAPVEVPSSPPAASFSNRCEIPSRLFVFLGRILLLL